MEKLPVGICWGTLWNADLGQMIEAAEKHGFPTLAITPPAYRRWLAKGGSAEQLRGRLKAADIAVTVIDPLMAGLPGMPPLAEIPEQFRDGFQHDEAYCVEVAKGVGAGIINIAHFLGRPTPVPVFAEAVRGIAGRVARHGLRVALEFIPDTGMPDLLTAEAIRKAAGAPNLGILLDNWHLARSGGTVEQVRALPPGAIIAAQLSDRVPPAPGAAYVPMAGRSLPGEGQEPIADILNAAFANNPGISVEVEVFNAELRELPPDAAAARVASATRAWLDKGGRDVRWQRA